MKVEVNLGQWVSSPFAEVRVKHHNPLIQWRGDRDSNPGNALTFNGFQDRRIRPLCHLPGHADRTVLRFRTRAAQWQGEIRARLLRITNTQSVAHCRRWAKRQGFHTKSQCLCFAQRRMRPENRQSTAPRALTAGQRRMCRGEDRQRRQTVTDHEQHEQAGYAHER